jgi:hypothetical protein
MKLLRVEFSGEELFNDSNFSFDLFASDRVMKPEDGEPLANVYKIADTRNIYSQNVIGISGVNASGKTTVVTLLQFAAQYLTMSYLVRSNRFASTAPAKLGPRFTFRAIFSDRDSVYALVSTIDRREGKDGPNWYRVADEQLYELRPQKLTKSLLESVEAFIKQATLIIDRNALPGERGALTKDQRTFLRDDMSVVMAVTGRRLVDHFEVTEGLEQTSYSTELVNAFDSSVEYLRWDPESEVYRLKFYGEPERSLSRDAAETQLSFGTLVGSEMVLKAVGILQEGGLMVIDEIESGLNKSLVKVIIDLFLSESTNPNGAQLVFTTHYPEILDFLPRKDDVYLLVRDADHRTKAVKYSSEVKRIENKKSEVVLSNYIKGTMPNYPDIRGLRNYVRNSVRGTRDE